MRDKIARAGGARAAVAGRAGRTATDRETRLTIRGTVAWCNRARGILMFEPEGAGASRRAIHFDHGNDEAKVKRLLRPGMVVTVSLRWRPEVDVLSPWQPEEIICTDGDRFTARP